MKKIFYFGQSSTFYLPCGPFFMTVTGQYLPFYFGWALDQPFSYMVIKFEALVSNISQVIYVLVTARFLLFFADPAAFSHSGNNLFEKKCPPETVWIFETTIHRTITI